MKIGNQKESARPIPVLFRNFELAALDTLRVHWGVRQADAIRRAVLEAADRALTEKPNQDPAGEL
jgi:hypothetical protein